MSDELKIRLLVVDDEPDMLRLVDAILTEQGYSVITAKGADAAIRTFEKMAKRPDRRDEPHSRMIESGAATRRYAPRPGSTG